MKPGKKGKPNEISKGKRDIWKTRNRLKGESAKVILGFRRRSSIGTGQREKKLSKCPQELD